MNERIAKLANECGFDVDKSGVFGNYSEMHRLEKFAELIVKECLSIVEPDVGMACGDEWYTALEGAAQEIKQHFGVEE